MAFHVRRGGVQTFYASRLDVWNHTHPCSRSNEEMGWPLRQLQTRLYVAHSMGVMCAFGRGEPGRSQRTAALIFDGLLEASAHQRIPDFRAVSVGIHDAHCSEVTLAYATLHADASNRSKCAALTIPSYVFSDVYEGESFSNKTATLARIAHAHQGRSRCGWAGYSLALSLYLPISPYISTYIHISPHTSHISPYLPGRSNSEGFSSLNPPHLQWTHKHLRARPRFVALAAQHAEIIEIVDTMRRAKAKHVNISRMFTTRHAPYQGEISLSEQVARWACLIDVTRRD